MLQLVIALAAVLLTVVSLCTFCTQGSERKILKKIEQNKKVREQVAAASVIGEQLQTASIETLFRVRP